MWKIENDLFINHYFNSTRCSVFSTKNFSYFVEKIYFQFHVTKKFKSILSHCNELPVLSFFFKVTKSFVRFFFTNVWLHIRSRNQSATFWLFYHTNNFRWIKKIENCSKDFKEKLIFLVLLAWLANWKYDWIECLLLDMKFVCFTIWSSQ